MPWLIQHKCTPDGPNEEYQIGHNTKGEPKTRFHCPKCGEAFFVDGHEFAAAARDMPSERHGIPGFLMPDRFNGRRS